MQNAGVTGGVTAEPATQARVGATQADKSTDLNAGTASNIQSATAAPPNSNPPSTSAPSSQTEAAYKQAALEAAKPAQQKGITMSQ